MNAARLLMLLPVLAMATPATAADRVTLAPIKYDALMARLASNPEGAKYTIIDAWATNCGPCKENFPHLVQMHEKFAKKGLAVISLSLDDPEDKAALKEAETFLKEKNAAFANYYVDEEFGLAYEKLGVNAIPAVFLYGPDGKEIRRFTLDDPDNQFTYDEVEKTVESLLAGKAPAAEKVEGTR